MTSGSELMDQESSVPKSSGKKNKRIESLEEFLTVAYGRKGQRVSLKSEVERRLAQQPILDADARARLLVIAGKDLVLAIPFQVLAVARGISGYPALRASIREFVRDAVALHPIFQTSELAKALRNSPEAPDLSGALRALLATVPGEGQASALGHLKGAEKKKLMTNSANLIALWYMETMDCSLEMALRLLSEVAWTPAAAKAKTADQQMRVVSECSNVAALGVAASLYQRESERASREALQAKFALDEQRGTAAALVTQTELFRQQIATLEDQIRVRDTRIEEALRASDAALSHEKQSFEELRGRLLGLLKTEVERLEDGLKALRLEAPLIEVTRDYVERSIARLRKEIVSLQQRG